MWCWLVKKIKCCNLVTVNVNYFFSPIHQTKAIPYIEIVIFLPA